MFKCQEEELEGEEGKGMGERGLKKDRCKHFTHTIIRGFFPAGNVDGKMKPQVL